MIEKFYAAHIKNRLDASAVNVRRPKVTTRKQVSEIYEVPVDPEAAGLCLANTKSAEIVD
jgi:hypothetical protein